MSAAVDQRRGRGPASVGGVIAARRKGRPRPPDCVTGNRHRRAASRSAKIGRWSDARRVSGVNCRRTAPRSRQPENAMRSSLSAGSQAGNVGGEGGSSAWRRNSVSPRPRPPLVEIAHQRGRRARSAPAGRAASRTGAAGGASAGRGGWSSRASACRRRRAGRTGWRRGASTPQPSNSTRRTACTSSRVSRALPYQPRLA